jgi:hypothetical protein
MPPLALLLPETLGSARILAVAQASAHADSLLQAQARTVQDTRADEMPGSRFTEPNSRPFVV